jgi:hypothetical protein
MKKLLILVTIALFFTIGGKAQTVIPTEIISENRYLPNQFADYVQWCKDKKEKNESHIAVSIGTNFVNKAVAMISPTIYTLKVRDDFNLIPTLFYNITFDTSIGNQLGYGLRVDSGKFAISCSFPLTQNGDAFMGVGFNL